MLLFLELCHLAQGYVESTRTLDVSLLDEEGTQQRSAYVASIERWLASKCVTYVTCVT